MNASEELKKVSEETMRFMRGNYVLDEIGDGVDKLEFCENGEAFLTIRTWDDHYDFCIDGKCVPVAGLQALESAKHMILSAKKPNRKPLPKEQAVYSDCGYRCDLCVHYTGGTISEALRAELKVRLIRVYAGGVGDGGYWGDDMAFCDGCASGNCMVSKPDALCRKKKCMASKGVERCQDCAEYPCYEESTAEFCRIGPRSMSAEDVTKAILPYTPGQLGN